MRALLSVYDKTGLKSFAAILIQAGYELVSTGGTLRFLRENSLPVTPASDVTNLPEILDGRVKTLHPNIYGGILARRDSPTHMDELLHSRIEPIDVVVNNLYPFQETIAKRGSTLEEALENIDIGGPAMIRAAAKNFQDVIVVVESADYELVGSLILEGKTDMKTRRMLAVKAFRHTADYDAAITSYLDGSPGTDELCPPMLNNLWKRVAPLRYGENPHQTGAVYSHPTACGGIANAKMLHGVPMSYLNYLDADAAWRSASSMGRHAVSIVKHANPCGLAVRDEQLEAYKHALEGDPVSAFGGIIGLNTTMTKATAQEMDGFLFDVVVAPGYEPDALDILRKRKRTRILEVKHESSPSAIEFRTVSGGVLVQTPDEDESPHLWRAVTKRQPDEQQMANLTFAWRVCRFIHSNGIAIAKDNALAGMGAGQPNRVASVELAIRTAGDKAKGAAMASDAFFPFPDSIERAATVGVSCIIQPGGSIRDEEVTAIADKLGLAMVHTNSRHFLH